MPYARTLRRGLSEDIIDQLELNGKVIRAKKPKSKKLAPRSFRTYRWCRRNLILHKWTLT